MPRKRPTNRNTHRKLRVERLEDRAMLAGDLELVRDVNATSPGSAPTGLVEVGGTLYFSADDDVTGSELWKSDGTAAGTVRVKDINVGPNGSSPASLTNVSGTLYFSAKGSGLDWELWKSDGTEAGTVRVRDINRGPGGSTPQQLTNVAGTLFFTATDGTTGGELWKSDGTSRGTVRVNRIPELTRTLNPVALTNFNGTLVFIGSDDSYGRTLMKSDGTEAGTTVVSSIVRGLSSTSNLGFAEVNGVLFFASHGPRGWRALWKTDGTEAGTTVVKEIWPNDNLFNGDRSYLRNFTNVSGTLHFSANDGRSGAELWRSDGTAAGTVQVKDINPRNSGIRPSSYPQHLTNVGGVLYFGVFDGVSGFELWKSDGAAAGTVSVRSGFPGASNPSGPSNFANVGGALYFVANDGINGDQLWFSDGTEGGTRAVLFRDGKVVRYSGSLTSIDDRLFVVGSRPDVGQELFTQILIDPPTLPGDFDRNGRVEMADFDLWSQTNGSTTKLRADGNGDGRVDQLDYAQWRQNYRVAPTKRPDFRPLGPATPPGSALPFQRSALAPAARTTFTPTRRPDLLIVASETPPTVEVHPATPARPAPRPSLVGETDQRALAIDEALAALFVKDDE